MDNPPQPTGGVINPPDQGRCASSHPDTGSVSTTPAVVHADEASSATANVSSTPPPAQPNVSSSPALTPVIGPQSSVLPSLVVQSTTQPGSQPGSHHGSRAHTPTKKRDRGGKPCTPTEESLGGAPTATAPSPNVPGDAGKPPVAGFETPHRKYADVAKEGDLRDWSVPDNRHGHGNGGRGKASVSNRSKEYWERVKGIKEANKAVMTAEKRQSATSRRLDVRIRSTLEGTTILADSDIISELQKVKSQCFPDAPFLDWDREMIADLCSVETIASIRQSGEAVPAAFALLVDPHVTAATLPYATRRAGILRLARFCSHQVVVSRPGSLSLAVMVYDPAHTGSKVHIDRSAVDIPEVAGAVPSWIVDYTSLTPALRSRVPDNKYGAPFVTAEEDLLDSSMGMTVAEARTPQSCFVFAGSAVVLKITELAREKGVARGAYFVAPSKLRVATAASSAFAEIITSLMTSGDIKWAVCYFEDSDKQQQVSPKRKFRLPGVAQDTVAEEAAPPCPAEAPVSPQQLVAYVPKTFFGSKSQDMAFASVGCAALTPGEARGAPRHPDFVAVFLSSTRDSPLGRSRIAQLGLSPPIIVTTVQHVRDHGLTSGGTQE